MNKLILRIGMLSGITLFSFVVITPLNATAQNGRAQEARTTVETTRQIVQTDAEARRTEAEMKRSVAKLKACEKREKSVLNIMTRLSDRGQKQLDLFSSIAQKTEKFYADKDRILSNYDALVSDVAVKKESAQTAVNTIKSLATEFSCDAEDPKASVAGFKESLKLEIEALKAYKTSVKNLIVGVKSVQGTTTSSENGEN